MEDMYRQFLGVLLVLAILVTALYLLKQRGLVRFTGARDDARALIALSDLLVFSSDWEGLSIAVLEALAAGTPIVTTDVQGMRELLSDGVGAIVPGFDPAALAAAISELLGDPARREQMASRGRERIVAEFSAAAMRDAYAEAYRALTD